MHVEVPGSGLEPAQLPPVAKAHQLVEPELGMDQIVEPLALVLLQDNSHAVAARERGSEIRGPKQVAKRSLIRSGTLITSPSDCFAARLPPIA
jgi:hypothetical protein